MKKSVLFAVIVCFTYHSVKAQESLQKLHPVSFSKVEVTDSFWRPRMETVAKATLQACVDYTENKTGRIRNFEKVARAKGEKHEGIYYDDSDVYKAIEAIAYSLRNHPDEALEKNTDEWIDKIAAAQLPDGYLNTYYTLTGLDKRWTDMEKHEDYNAGHLIEAGIAYFNTTGKDKLLNVSIRFADHIDSMFRKQNRNWVSGHQEIELALMKLYHHTGNRNYLNLAEWFLDQRGRGHGKGVIWDQWKQPEYCQDLLPVKEQREITGHAVRAMYMYTGAADVAAVTNDKGYIDAMNAVWEDVVYRNMYITGGIGAQGKNEGFGVDFDLPNETAYCETCASVGMVFWNQRMNMLTGNARYVDILEKSLYNGALDGLSLSGDRFFYGNPLASRGTHARREWFGTACCPSNIARLVASVGDYIYATSSNTLWVNLYVGSNSTIEDGKNKTSVSMQTGYPWKGNVRINIDPQRKRAFTVKLRAPGWLSRPSEGDLYSYQSSQSDKPTLLVNGAKTEPNITDGYITITRTWKKGDVIDLEFPMQVRAVVSRPELKYNQGRIAVQYGPLVYCVEGRDNDGKAMNLVIPGVEGAKVSFEPDFLGGVNSIMLPAQVVQIGQDSLSLSTTSKQVKAIPYHRWNNRGPGEMLVWIPVAFRNILVNE